MSRLVPSLALAAVLLLGSSQAALAASGSVSYEYDTLGRLILATYADGSQIRYSYDAAGNRTQVVIAAGANQSPIANNDTVSTSQNTAATFDPRANDSDPNSDPLTLTAKTDGAHGTVAINSGASLTYTPASGYIGSDSFTYTISNGRGGTALGTVSVTVTAPNHAPVANNDTTTTTLNSAKTIDPRTNDTDADGDTLSVTGVGTPGHGGATYTSTSVTYTPTTGYSGSDSFTYTISDGHGGTASATVSVTVSGANHAPVANADTMDATAPIGSAAIGTVGPLANDTDADGDTLTITSFTNGTKGTVSQPSAGVLQYLANTASAFGSDTFTYTISDGHGGTATATVTVTLTHESP